MVESGSPEAAAERETGAVSEDRTESAPPLIRATRLRYWTVKTYSAVEVIEASLAIVTVRERA